MLVGAIEYFLILVTLLAVIVGVVFSPSRPVKAVIVCLAIASSVGTAIKTSGTAREAEINRKLVTTVVHASYPPEYFSHDLVKNIAPLLKESGQVVSRQLIDKGSGERILTLAKTEDDSEVSGVLFFSRNQLNPIVYQYVIGGDVAKPLSTHISQSWTDCHDHWNACFAEMLAISKFAMEIAPIGVEETTATFTEDLLFSVTSSETYRGAPIRIDLDKKFIGSLYGLPPDKRGARILAAGHQRVISKL